MIPPTTTNRRLAELTGERRSELIWAVALGVVLADSSIVTLALPDILARYDASVSEVSWVLISFNLVLALVVVPLARVARGRSSGAFAYGVVIFSGASAVCALAPELAVLIAGRCAQAVGGALIAASAIELIASSRGSHQDAAPIWGAAGLAGLALGPALGGFLTQIFSWESIFALQVPLALVLLAKRDAPTLLHRAEVGGRFELRPELALALISAGLTGALFLLVIMLVEGWRLTPLQAALVVSVMPVATLAGRVIARRVADPRSAMLAGTVLVAGGLFALGLLPGASWGWTLAPQILIGIGLAFTVPGMTQWALQGRDPDGRRAVGTIAARHVGVVAGLILLTPIFTQELKGANIAAQRSGTALLLDAPLAATTKVDLGGAIADQIERADGRLPELGPAFSQVGPASEEADDYGMLADELDSELEKAATSAFSLAFLAAGAVSLAAAIPLLRRRRT